jgi:4-hydroxy-tetrahydrodipicolinate reductase
MVDFTAPDVVEANVAAALEREIPCVIGTSSFDHARVDALARDRGIACFHAPNFALGAVLMMRFAREAAAHMPRAAIVEMHDEAKKDAPSDCHDRDWSADPEIYSVRLPGLVAHQRFSRGRRPTLTIRHDNLSEAFVPGVVLAPSGSAPCRSVGLMRCSEPATTLHVTTADLDLLPLVRATAISTTSRP